MATPDAKPYRLPSDAVWFITGCSSGIGQALAQVILETSSSNRVVATARKLSALSNLNLNTNSKRPDHDPDGRILKHELDVTSRASIDAAFAATLERFGRVDVVVNNAGYTLAGDTEAASDADARAVLDTNFWGMVDVTKRAIGVMRDVNGRDRAGQQRGGGVVVNVSSVGGWIGYPGQAFYHASKFAMEGWTESVAKELPASWNIHLTAIEPGGVKTNYATTSLKRTDRHPAYADPSYPTNALLSHMSRPENQTLWAEPRDLAAAVYRVVSRGGRIPIRVPLGADSWGLIARDLDETRKLLDEVKEISHSVGDAKQLDAVSFLK
ncbi:short-chain dehydrogenase [Xylariaceae sp. FL0594]|nr:short-chain dehydrogenase [Xylariaceae sp. FL0594]